MVSTGEYQVSFNLSNKSDNPIQPPVVSTPSVGSVFNLKTVDIEIKEDAKATDKVVNLVSNKVQDIDIKFPKSMATPPVITGYIELPSPRTLSQKLISVSVSDE